MVTNHEVSVKVADANHLDTSRCLQQSTRQTRLGCYNGV